MYPDHNAAVAVFAANMNLWQTPPFLFTRSGWLVKLPQFVSCLTSQAIWDTKDDVTKASEL